MVSVQKHRQRNAADAPIAARHSSPDIVERAPRSDRGLRSVRNLRRLAQSQRLALVEGNEDKAFWIVHLHLPASDPRAPLAARMKFLSAFRSSTASHVNRPLR